MSAKTKTILLTILTVVAGLGPLATDLANLLTNAGQPGVATAVVKIASALVAVAGALKLAYSDTLSSRKVTTILPPPLPLLCLCLLLGGCLSSAPLVPVTSANTDQVSTCQATASAHNGFVVAGMVLGGLDTGLGVAAGADTNTSQKTGFAVGAAAGAAAITTVASLAALYASNFAESNCSSVVGPLPVATPVADAAPPPLDAGAADAFPPGVSK